MRRIKQQEDGKFGIWETITDSWVEENLTVYEAWDLLYEPQIEEYERQVKKFLKLRRLLFAEEWTVDEDGFLVYGSQLARTKVVS